MEQLYQGEWCPHSSRVRERFTELGVSFIARQVPAERVDREEMRRKTGTDEIPALLLEDATAVTGGAGPILEYLDARYSERSDAAAHRRRVGNEADPIARLPPNVPAGARNAPASTGEEEELG